MKTTKSKRYDDKYWTYWWDLTTSDIERLQNGESLRFFRKDDSLYAIVSPDDLLPHLKPKNQTSRGRGNWGVRTLQDKQQAMRIEVPGTSYEDWPSISVTWQEQT